MSCPNGGYKTDGPIGVQQPDCGLAGYLCDMCKADRADACTDRLVEGLALAGLLGGNWDTAAEIPVLATDLADALRERDGGS